MSGPEAHEDLHAIAATIQERFEQDRSLLSFADYYALFLSDPGGQIRGTAAYVLDAIEASGTREIEGHTRYQIFDATFDEGRDPLVAQEGAQAQLVRILRNFVRDGRVSKLILIHGPNGSAKTRFVSCLYRALEHYSRGPEGPLYRFNWVFPTKAAAQKRLGFGEGSREGGDARGAATGVPSFAKLAEDAIEARLPCALKDHPLLLLPADQRRALFTRLRDEGQLDTEYRVPDYLLYGDLSGRNRRIADTLLAMYAGDYAKVLRHVQVERYYLSARYQEGLVTILPQMQVDAEIRQLTMNQGLGVLPNILKNVELFDPTGDLVDANRGMIEYDDLLKRPVESFKYLLTACEGNRINLPRTILFLDTVMVATSNDTHVEAFKQYPDFVSFKERVELVRMPYMLDYRTEAEIYREMFRLSDLSKPVSPHTLELAALWAVATRMKPPKAEIYPNPMKKYVRKLKPVEKAAFYAGGRGPEWVEASDRGEFEGLLEAMQGEDNDKADYEGSSGISPREMKTLLLNAAQNPDHRCLTPLSVFAEIRRITGETSVYDFLQREAKGDYYNIPAIVDQCEAVLLQRVNQEFLDAAGLMKQEQVLELFTRYINETSRWLKGEKVQNAHTKKYEDADPKFIESMERRFGLAESEQKDPRRSREKLIQRIAAFRIDNPDGQLDYGHIFADLFDKLRTSYFDEHRSELRQLRELFVEYLTEADDRDTRGERPGAPKAESRLDKKQRARVESVMQRLSDRHGYSSACALETLAFLEGSLYERAPTPSETAPASKKTTP